MEDTAVQLAPVSGRARIDLLDILRGMAILGIYFLNIPVQAASFHTAFGYPAAISWTFGDQQAYFWIGSLLEGTQRGLLELLFGAGMMILASRAMAPDGPVAVADLYLRRSLFLILFGLVDVFLALWKGDILVFYGLAGLFIFPLRKLGPKALLALGLVYSLYFAVSSVPTYLESAHREQRVVTAQSRLAPGNSFGAEDRKVLDDERQRLDAFAHPMGKAGERILNEIRAHDTATTYAGYLWSRWLLAMQSSYLFLCVAESIATMLIGIALWKWGVIQGSKSRLFYGATACACYAVALPLRMIMQNHWFLHDALFDLMAVFYEFDRLGLTIGHLCLIVLIVKTATGAKLLAPFKAAGRAAFSIYFLQQIIGLHVLFSPYGFNLWNRVSWVNITLIAAAMFLGLLILANIWMRYFLMGPFEWAWRSLSYLERQPFRRAAAA